MISAIIPVYNTEEVYLRRCIQSILEQTYGDYEIVIVDDGSEKKCADILDELQQTDRRIHVWHKENEGVSSARNFGISMSKGEFICFIDSDDTVEKGFFETAIYTLDDNIDLLIGKTKWIIDGDVLKYNVNTDLNCTHTDTYCLQTEDVKKDIFKKLLLGPSSSEGFQPEVWCKVFRRDIIGELEFDKNIVIGEDQIFVVEYLMKCRTIRVLNTHWYNYYVYQNSSLRKNDVDKADKFIRYYKRLAYCFNLDISGDILPEKAYITLNELMKTYLGNRYSDASTLQREYQAYKKFKNDRFIKEKLKQIPITSLYAGSVDAICCRLGFTKRGIKLIILNMYAGFKELLSRKNV